ncbi:hypothetical protein K438DRAFT_1804437 [Mycena galopus ATCC 62051]|nr:hypothetical protein K438DRAFT_1804437 [Mycena galopus ATCC 62051]
MLRSPRISSFSVSACVLMPEKFPLAWTKLTTLIIGGSSTWPNQSRLTSDATLRVVSACSRLQCCKLTIHDEPETPTLTYSIAELPFLHTLAVRCASYAASTVPVLLMHLSLPELRSFTFIGQTADSPALADFFANLLRLESFTTAAELFSRPALLKTLRGLPPAIQRLHMRQVAWGSPEPSLDDDVLAVLNFPGLCPALQSLEIDDQSLSISEEAVVRFLSARMLESPPTLKHVGVKFGRQKGLDVMPSIQPFLELGLTVSLDYLPYSSWQFSPWRGLDDAPVPEPSPPFVPVMSAW